MPSSSNRARTVTLAIRIRLASGKRRYAKPVFSGNGRLMALCAIVDGRPEHHPEGVYALRYKSFEAKHVWEGEGSDPQMALTAKLRRENLLQAEALGMAITTLPTAPSAGSSPKKLKCESTGRTVSLGETVAEFLRETTARNRPKTLAAYRQALTLFLESCCKQHIGEITKADATDFATYLRNKGNSPRTAANRVRTLRSLLRWAGRMDVVTKREIPKYTEKVVKAYSRNQMATFLKAAPADEQIIWRFFLGSGGREQEVMYATWRDIDFESGLFEVREKLDLGFTIKDGEERSVPLPDSLLDLLRHRRDARPQDRLLFPTPSGKPDGHLLRRLKKTAFTGGLNCGHCMSKSGLSCADHPVCKTWELHRLRKTMATLHHEAGVSARTLMRWLGHSDFATTLKYLEAADVRSDRTRAMVNRTFEFDA